jgi:hypothetical protein
LARGTFGELIPILEPMVREAPEIGPAYVAALAHALLWGMMLAQRNAPGDLDRAREFLADAREARHDPRLHVRRTPLR